MIAGGKAVFRSQSSLRSIRPATRLLNALGMPILVMTFHGWDALATQIKGVRAYCVDLRGSIDTVVDFSGTVSSGPATPDGPAALPRRSVLK